MGTLLGSHAQRRLRRRPLSLACDRCRNDCHPRPARRTGGPLPVALFSEPFLIYPPTLMFLGFFPPVLNHTCPRRGLARHSCAPPRFRPLVQFFLLFFHCPTAQRSAITSPVRGVHAPSLYRSNINI